MNKEDHCYLVTFSINYLPGMGVQLIRASSHTPKDWGFDSWLGHIPRLWVQSPVGMCRRGTRSMFLSHIDVSFSLSLSLPPFVSLKSINISLGED